MRLLLTNDDGVGSEGLRVLARAMREEGHDVLIVAPLGDVSGSGTSLGTFADSTVIKAGTTVLDGLEDVQTHWVDAPPSFAVLAACLGRFGPPPEVVVSGINPGWNTGRYVLFSSTVGAALTASMVGRSALAISCGDLPGARFDTAAQVARSALRWLIEHARPRTVLNVNVPDVDPEAIKSVRPAPLSPVSTAGLDLSPVDGGLRLHRFVNTERVLVPRLADTDAGLVAAGHVAVTGLLGGARELPAEQIEQIVTAMSKELVAPEGARP
ncbi:5'/3'-nucleotidase SurE [uncultured Thermomonospora sp.]|uniref:5'/3'-nucleotidase SurE n=1 Tax=uncultured Thermomonospora sp. TaxID=671175 RepID=UPI00259AFBBD|nr:5'/3'-nucleotidase SurE [uncultured Thermomonospora sp.]